MPDQLQLRGGTTTEHSNFTGVSKEVTVDTTKHTLVVHNGTEAGGFPLMRESGSNEATTVGIGTGGTNAININDTQKVGIGTASPSYKLEVSAETAISGDTRFLTGSRHKFIGGGSGNNLELGTYGNSNTTRNIAMVMDSAGKVGIGTESPATKLHVENSSGDAFLRLTGSTNYGVSYRRSSDNAQIGYTGNGGAVNLGAVNLGLSASQASGNIVFQTGGTAATNERMRILSDGKVGIGLTDPDQKLEVDGIIKGSSYFQGGASATSTYNYHFGAEGDGTFRIYRGNYGAGSERFRINSDGKTGIGAIDPSTAQLVVYRQTTNSNNPILQARSDYGATNDVKFEIDGNGNVGVGTESPAHLIHAKNSSVSTTKIVVESTGTDSYPAFRIKNDDRAYDLGIDGASDAFRIYDVTAPKERFRIDKDGRILFNMSSALDTTAGSLNISGGTAGGRIAMQGTTTNANTNIAEFFSHWGTNKVAGFIARSGTDTTNKDDGELGFYTRTSGEGLTENLTIATNGNVGIGTTSPNDKLEVHGPITQVNTSTSITSSQLFFDNNTSGGQYRVRFDSNNSTVGSISVGTSSTAYNTSSDYRLKENITTISDGITRLKSLKPRRFNWKSDSSTIVDGFIAHEVTAVPEAVTGTKDAIATEDSKEAKKGDPIYQQIDQSKLVPLLTAALQEAITKIEILETKVAALEAK